MSKEKDKRVLAFQAKFNELKEKLPILKHAELLRHAGRTWDTLTIAYLEFPCVYGVDFLKEKPDVLVSVIRLNLIEAANEIERNLKTVTALLGSDNEHNQSNDQG